MNTKLTTYEQRGVSSSKEEVHKAIAKQDKGLFPGAFCKILPDYLGLPPDPKVCNVLHADTSGTKPSLAYLVWKSTGDVEAVAGLAVDALVMNVDDVGCVGATGHLLANQTVGRNKFIIPGELVEAVIERASKFCAMLTAQGIPCHSAGGETADVGDIVRTLDIGSSVVVRMKQKDVIDASDMAHRDIIIGFSSTGQAAWEDCKNTGIGANGLTNGRHDCLSPYYHQFHETYAPEMNPSLVYRGPYLVNDIFPGDKSFTIGKALLSPTRTYLPLIKKVLKAVGRKNLHGIIHCSGGGQTKIGKFGTNNHYIKYNLFPVPPMFTLLQMAGKLPWKEMYQVYNMGHRLEMVVPDSTVAREIIDISMRECTIDARIVGEVRTVVAPGPNNIVSIKSPHGEFEYCM